MNVRVKVTFWMEFEGAVPDQKQLDMLEETFGLADLVDTLQDMVYGNLDERPVEGCAGLWDITAQAL